MTEQIKVFTRCDCGKFHQINEAFEGETRSGIIVPLCDLDDNQSVIAGRSGENEHVVLTPVTIYVMKPRCEVGEEKDDEPRNK